jgi:hypothetical protein
MSALFPTADIRRCKGIRAPQDESCDELTLAASCAESATCAREIAARTKPRFIDTAAERPQTLEGMRKLARAIAARSEPRFVVIPPQRGG